MCRSLFLVLLSCFLLQGCQSTQVKKVSQLRTNVILLSAVKTPIDLPVAIYVNKEGSEEGYNFFTTTEETSIKVASSYFNEVSAYEVDSKYKYLFKIDAQVDWTSGWETQLKLTVLDNNGSEIYTTTTDAVTSAAYSKNTIAVKNSIATAVKEAYIKFLNNRGAKQLSQDIKNGLPQDFTFKHPKDVLVDLKPYSSGTAFYINNNGNLLTAEHVLRKCLFSEIKEKGENIPTKFIGSSKLLDLAVLSSERRPNISAVINKKETNAHLGKTVFVTGFPLSGILSDSPTLTVGNISSLGGLKGSKAHFQLSAPVQPGNSGSAIVDYKGNLVGMVSSSLNQKMLAEKTGTLAQNVNFGVDLSLIKKFLDKNNISYQEQKIELSFEESTSNAVSYSKQVLCYR